MKMKKFELKSSRTFENEVHSLFKKLNGFSGTLFYVLALLGTQLFMTLPFQEHLILFGLVVICVYFSQNILSPKLDKLLVSDLSENYEEYKKGNLDIDEKTELVKQFLKCPNVLSKKNGISIAATCVIPFIFVIVNHKITPSTYMFLAVVLVLCTYNAILRAYSKIEGVCCAKVIDIVESGINHETITSEEFHGYSMYMRMLSFCIFPLGLCILLHIFHVNMVFNDSWQLPDMAFGAFIIEANTLYIILSGYFSVYGTVKKSTNDMIEILEQLVENHGKYKFLPTDLSNDMAYSIYQINLLIEYLHSISEETMETGEQIYTFTKILSNEAKDTADTSIYESSAIRQCLATLENEKNQHGRVSKAIAEMKDDSFKTKVNVETANNLLAEGIRKMSEITQANLDTIYGIKTLFDKIDNIINLITEIDSVVERIKTIAFNAELEASNAGEKGDKFHIVANEILRMASSVSSSTSFMKKKITDIQHSCDNLIITSEAGTQKTREGSEFYTDLEADFSKLNISSEVTAESLTKIMDITEIQRDAFNQINQTFIEIYEGFEMFSQTAQKISHEAQILKDTATTLGYSGSQVEGGER